MAGRGLSTADLDQIKQVLAGGKRPRVMFTDQAGQIAGQVGQVVALEDPKSSDEWIVVKFGGDALPFSPADLTLPPRGGAPAKKAPAKATEPTATTPSGRKPLAIGDDLLAREAAQKEAAQKEAAQKEAAQKEAAKKAAGPTPAGAEPTGGTAPANQPPARKEPSVSEATPASSADSPATTPRKPAGRAPKIKPPAGLTVTLAYTDGEWTVGAMQGAKALAKPYVIKPAEALKMVGMLDVPGVQEAVEQILSTERDAAKAQADKLRAELAEVEAKLAELGI
jgi:hypothetical protein